MGGYTVPSFQNEATHLSLNAPKKQPYREQHATTKFY